MKKQRTIIRFRRDNSTGRFVASDGIVIGRSKSRPTQKRQAEIRTAVARALSRSTDAELSRAD